MSINYYISLGWHLDLGGQTAHSSKNIKFIKYLNQDILYKRESFFNKKPQAFLSWEENEHVMNIVLLSCEMFYLKMPLAEVKK